ncbi:hypothetical protein GCM10027442_46630 [Emticicia fontis]
MTLFAAYQGYENKEGLHGNSCNKKVAVIIFSGVEIIDFTGPWEVLAAAGMQVYSVSVNDATVATSMGLKIKPDYTFENAPAPDIVLIPGGNLNPSEKTITDWILKMSKQTEHLMSVCNGAFYLSKVGLLDNLTATTFYSAIERLKQITPKAIVVDSVRYADNGKIITAAGLSSGIDAAFHLVSMYLGKAQAKKLAVELEYNWQEEQQFVRGKLADKYVLDILNVLIPFDYVLTNYNGNEEQWQVSANVKATIPKDELQNLFRIQLEQAAGWQKTEIENKWTKKDRNKNWFSTIQIHQTESNMLEVRFSISHQ